MNEIIQSLISGSILQTAFFLIVLAFFIWYAFAIIYHFIRFGVGTTPKILALVFFIGSFLLFAFPVTAYFKVNWSEIFRYILNNLKMP